MFLNRSLLPNVRYIVCAWIICGFGFGMSAEDHPSQSKPKIQPYPDAAVWTDAAKASMEWDGFEFVGEFVQDDRAMQVTPSEGRFYVSIYDGGFPGTGWNGKPIVHEWLDREGIESRVAGWQKVDRSAAVVGKKPPADAIVLFDGSNTQAWQNGKIEDGVLKAGARTKHTFWDFRLYLEFMIPLKPEPPISHPHRGNSGVFAVGAYEVQISDNFGLDPDPRAWQDMDMLKPVNTWCGSIYGIREAD